MMQEYNLAVLMTCHNRQAKTLACLEKLFQQSLPETVKIQVYLVDDGSTDGTTAAVMKYFPAVKVFPGSGNLFWNGGMRLAFSEAVKYNYDFYLWLNDDTLLYPQAINCLIQTYEDLIQQNYQHPVIVGSTQDPKTGQLTYGGVSKSSWWHPLKFDLVEPGVSPKPCLTLNGNCVLISREVANLVGNLDSGFIHSTGDLDYGLRVQQQGGSVWIAPGYLGTCEYNAIRHQAWDEPNLTLRQRWQKINQPKGLPVYEWKLFSSRHAGLLWPFYWLIPYIRLFLKSPWVF